MIMIPESFLRPLSLSLSSLLALPFSLLYYFSWHDFCTLPQVGEKLISVTGAKCKLIAFLSVQLLNTTTKCSAWLWLSESIEVTRIEWHNTFHFSLLVQGEGAGMKCDKHSTYETTDWLGYQLLEVHITWEGIEVKYRNTTDLSLGLLILGFSTHFPVHSLAQFSVFWILFRYHFSFIDSTQFAVRISRNALQVSKQLE